MVFGKQSALWSQLDDYFPDEVGHIFRELFSNGAQDLVHNGPLIIRRVIVRRTVRGPIAMVLGVAVENWCKDMTVKVLYQGEVLTVEFWNTEYGDPNVVEGQDVRFYKSVDGLDLNVAVGGYIDRPIGQFVLWMGPPPPRQGWAYIQPLDLAPDGSPAVPVIMPGEFLAGPDTAGDDSLEHLHDDHDPSGITAHAVGKVQLDPVTVLLTVTVDNLTTTAEHTGGTSDFDEIEEVTYVGIHGDHADNHEWPDPGITAIVEVSGTPGSTSAEVMRWPAATPPEGRGYNYNITYGPGGFPASWDGTHTVSSNPHTHEHSGDDHDGTGGPDFVVGDPYPHTHNIVDIPSMEFLSQAHIHPPGLDVESPWAHTDGTLGAIKHVPKETIPPFLVMAHFVRVDNSCTGPWRDQVV